MEIYILRHAIAEDLNQSVRGGDSQRRLTSEGAKKMHSIARGMKAASLSFDLILSSPYLRAKETAEIVAKLLRPVGGLKLSPVLTPDGSPKDLIDLLKKTHSKRKRIVLVGHEPYLTRLISLLLFGDTGISIDVKKGGLCKLSIKTLRYGRCATLNYLLTPRQLRLMA
jgi:phosphohistidine phosphatase